MKLVALLVWVPVVQETVTDLGATLGNATVGHHVIALESKVTI